MTRDQVNSASAPVVDNRIYFDDYIGICEASYVNVNRAQPPAVEAHMTKSQWEDFCSNVDKDMKPLGIIRPVLWRLALIYALLVVGLFLLTHFLTITIFGSFLVDFLISLGIFLFVSLVFVVKVRYGVIRAVQRRCRIESRQLRDRLKLEARLPFCQFRGKMTSGWCIYVREQRKISKGKSPSPQSRGTKPKAAQKETKETTPKVPINSSPQRGHHTRAMSPLPMAPHDFEDPGV